MNNKNFNNYIQKVNINVRNIYNAFYLWKNLQNTKYKDIYNRYNYFWGITILSIQLNWLLGIPKLFEKSKRRKEEVISIPFLLEFIPEGEDKEKIKKEIIDQKPILKNLKEWRNKILAHQDRVVADDIEDFYKKFPVKGEQIEELLSSTAKILGMIKSTRTSQSFSYSYSLVKDMSKRNLDSIISKLKD
jgi:hypothetical protein